jgi:hypothetical protein
MAVITWPAALRAPAEWTLSQARYDMLENSDATGHMAARLLGPPRWRVSLRCGDGFTLQEAGIYEAMLLQLRGGVNHLAVHDFVRAAPQGSMRGTMTLNGAHAAGVAALSVTAGAGQASRTLLAGDWLQLGTGLGTSQLVKVMAAATSDAGGVIALTIEPPLRIGFAGGAAVAWDKPLAYFKQTGAPQWSYRPAMRQKQSGFALDLLESWT